MTAMEQLENLGDDNTDFTTEEDSSEGKMNAHLQSQLASGKGERLLTSSPLPAHAKAAVNKQQATMIKISRPISPLVEGEFLF